MIDASDPASEMPISIEMHWKSQQQCAVEAETARPSGNAVSRRDDGQTESEMS